MIYFISLVCLCLLIDAIYVMYLYNKTQNFIIQKNKEANKLIQRPTVYRKPTAVFKKDTRFDAMKRKLGGA